MAPYSLAASKLQALFVLSIPGAVELLLVMVNSYDLRKGNILYKASKALYLELIAIMEYECTVKPYHGGESFTSSYEDLDGVDLTSDMLTLSGFKEINEGEDYYLDGINVHLAYETFFIMDRTDTALSVRLDSLHHLQNVYSALKRKQLPITLPTYS